MEVSSHSLGRESLCCTRTTELWGASETLTNFYTCLAFTLSSFYSFTMIGKRKSCRTQKKKEYMTPKKSTSERAENKVSFDRPTISAPTPYTWLCFCLWCPDYYFCCFCWCTITAYAFSINVSISKGIESDEEISCTGEVVLVSVELQTLVDNILCPNHVITYTVCVDR